MLDLVEALPFGALTVPDAVGRRDVALVPLRSSALNVSVLTFGASLHTVETPDRNGRMDQVNLSMPTMGDYQDRTRNAYVGATCGRYANRIANGAFTIDGHRAVLETNDGPNQLHGGPDGFARRIWDLIEVTMADDGGRVVLALDSPDGDQGYPGALKATATYELHGHTLRVTYEAVTDAPTVVNLTNHAYWNLGGVERWGVDGSAADHELRVPGEQVLLTDDTQIPSGPLAHVGDSPLDLRHSPLLLDVLEHRRRGIDHSYVVPTTFDAFGEAHGLNPAAELHHPLSGRTLTVATDQPAVHVYTANKLGAPFGRQAAVCLETQRFPDAPNRPDLGNAILRPGEHYRSHTEITFGVR